MENTPQPETEIGTALDVVAPRPRRRRSDAGTIRHTPRDAAAMAWLAQMYGARADTLAHLLGCSTARAARVAERWERAGWVRRVRVEAGAPQWVYPTPGTVAEQMGWERAGTWSPTLNNARHTHTAGMVRAWLQGGHGQMLAQGWTSERELRKQDGASRSGVRRTHVPDGVWHRGATADAPPTQSYVIEVELSPKSLPRMVELMQVNAGVASRYGDTARGRVLYVVPSQSMTDHVVRGRNELERIDPTAAQRVDVYPMASFACGRCPQP